MSTRQPRRHPGPAPASLLIAIGFLAVTGLVLPAALIALAITGLAAVAVTALVLACRAHSRRPAPAPTLVLPPVPASPAPALLAERDQLAARIRDLEGQLASARESAHRAWDQAASIPARAIPDPDCPGCQDRAKHAARVAALLADSRSGARPLTGGQR